MHTVVALALPDVVAFDLAIPAQIFGHRSERGRYHFSVCTPDPGPVPSSTGFAVHADRGLDALTAADTVVVPGYWPPQHPGEPVVTALRAAAVRGARMVSVCTGAFALAAAAGGRPPTGTTPPTSPPATFGCGSTPTCCGSTRARS